MNVGYDDPNVWYNDSEGEYYVEIGTPARKKWRELRHDDLNGHWGRLVLEVTCRTPLFIGSGEYDLFENAAGRKEIFQPFTAVPDPDAAGASLPIVPGSSLKGVLRSYAEALSPSCEGSGCKECICCRVFGSLGTAGLVTVFDSALLPREALKKQAIAVRHGRNNQNRGGRRFYPHSNPADWTPEAKEKPGEWVEALKAGTVFPVEIQFGNLGRAELGLLFLALGLSTSWPFALKAGGGKNRGLGSIQFKLNEITFWQTPANDAALPEVPATVTNADRVLAKPPAATLELEIAQYHKKLDALDRAYWPRIEQTLTRLVDETAKLTF